MQRQTRSLVVLILGGGLRTMQEGGVSVCLQHVGVEV